MSRPAFVIGIVGTDTEVGKTWIGARLTADLVARGLTVSVRKPVQSFASDDDGPTDRELLAASSGESPDDVCPPRRSLPVPMAPPMASDVLGVPGPRRADLVAELSWSDGVDVGVVETVGGACSPVAADGHSADLVRDVAADLVLLVADAGLGTIGAVRSNLLALEGLDTVIVLNRFDPEHDLHRRNFGWLRDVDGLQVATDVSTISARVATVRR